MLNTGKIRFYRRYSKKITILLNVENFIKQKNDIILI